MKNGEQLDGIRAGANAEREALLKVLTTNGTEEVMRSLDSIEPKADQPSSHSDRWLEGFRHGVGWMRERVRSKRQNHSEIEKELRHAVDSRDDKRQ